MCCVDVMYLAFPCDLSVDKAQTFLTSDSSKDRRVHEVARVR